MNLRLVIGAAAVLLLSACGQAAPPSSNVASLRSSDAGAPSAAVTAPSDGEQPRLRMDMTEEEKQRLYDAHTACLAEKDPNATGTGAGPVDMSGTRKRYNDEAWKACAKKWPLPPWEMDSGNPAFKDNWHKNVQCLNSRGVKVIETEPGSWTYDGEQTLSPDERLKIEKECEQEVFGGGRK